MRFLNQMFDKNTNLHVALNWERCKIQECPLLDESDANSPSSVNHWPDGSHLLRAERKSPVGLKRITSLHRSTDKQPNMSFHIFVLLVAVSWRRCAAQVSCGLSESSSSLCDRAGLWCQTLCVLVTGEQRRRKQTSRWDSLFHLKVNVRFYCLCPSNKFQVKPQMNLRLPRWSSTWWWNQCSLLELYLSVSARADPSTSRGV